MDFIAILINAAPTFSRRLVNYLLKRYIGQFVEKEITTEQINLKTEDGHFIGSIRDVKLNYMVLNTLLEEHGIPLEVIQGYVGLIEIKVSNILSNSAQFSIDGVELTLQPKKTAPTGSHESNIDLMLNSMTHSTAIIEDCLEDKEMQAGDLYMSPVDICSKAIESVISRIQVDVANVTVRLECGNETDTGPALELKVQNVQFSDAKCKDEKVEQSTKNQVEGEAFGVKNLCFTGISLFCDQPRAKKPSLPSTPISSYIASMSSDMGHPITSQPTNAGLRDSPDSSSNSSDESEIPDPIEFARFGGKLEVHLKYKRNEEMAGPKFELDGSFGSLTCFLTPKQIELIQAVAEALTLAGNVCSDWQQKLHRGGGAQPMMPSDFEIAEEAMRHDATETINIGEGLRDNAPWGGSTLDDSTMEDFYDPQSTLHDDNHMDASVSSINTEFSVNDASTVYNCGAGYSKRSSPFRSTYSDEAQNRLKNNIHRNSLHKLLDDTTSEVAQVHLQVSAVSVVVLHEDPPASPGDKLDPAVPSWQKLHRISTTYFQRIQGFSMTSTELPEIRSELTQACLRDNISFIGKPVTVTFNHKQSSKLNTTDMTLSIGMAELVEGLLQDRSLLKNKPVPVYPGCVQVDYCELLTFPSDDVNDSNDNQAMFTSMYTPNPVIEVSISNVSPVKQYGSPTKENPNMKIDVQLAPCCSELDITILDRLQPLMRVFSNPNPNTTNAFNRTQQYNSDMYMTCTGTLQSKAQYNPQRFGESDFAYDEYDSSSTKKTVNIRVSGTSLQLNVRFPVPDLRSGLGVQRIPSWRRSLNLRPEVLILCMNDPDFNSTYSSEPCHTFAFMCADLKAYFKEQPQGGWMFRQCINQSIGHLEPLLVLTSAPGAGKGFDQPRMEIKIYPEHVSTDDGQLLADHRYPGLERRNSLSDICCADDDTDTNTASPFSSKRVVYNNEPLVIPGSAEDQKAFHDAASQNTKLYIDLTLPCVSARLPDKRTFELLYNRINNDMLLWEPQAPDTLDMHDSAHIDKNPIRISELLPSDSKYQSYDDGSSSSSSDSDDENENGWDAVSDEKRYDPQVVEERRAASKQGAVCVKLHVNHARLHVFTDLKLGNEMSQTDHGEFLLDARDVGVVCSVKHNGNPHLAYVSITLNNGTLYHSGCVSNYVSRRYGPVHDIRAPIPSYLKPLVHLTDPIMLLPDQRNGEQHMLTVALEINMNHKTNMKFFQLSMGARGCTLQHQMYHTGENWFIQLVDYFDVVDQEIWGYVLPKVTTELHFNLWNCSIEYRPLHLPIMARVRIGMFSISSNIIAECATSLLKFILEDSFIELAEQPSTVLNGCVTVAHIVMFQLAITSNDGRDPTTCAYEVAASNTEMHVYTCADSARALCDLIQYIVNDGDLCTIGTSEEDSMDEMIDDTILEEDVESELDKAKQKHVEDLIGDALLEDDITNHANSEECDDTPQRLSCAMDMSVFDDVLPSSSTSTVSSRTSSVEQLSSRSGSPAHMSVAIPTTTVRQRRANIGANHDAYPRDEEFWIVEHDPRTAVPRGGEPIVKKLVEGEIKANDHHFKIPEGEIDQLRAPGSFPIPVKKYVLDNWTLVWHLLAGSDFKTENVFTTHAESTTRLSAQTHDRDLFDSHKSSNAKDGTLNDIQSHVVISPGDQRIKGGKYRKNNAYMELLLNKVRMQYELYPDNAKQVSRHILSIQDIEITDKLPSSALKKFLYLHTSEQYPKQTNASMVLVKMLTVKSEPTATQRPEASLRVAVQPLRLNMDQDALKFLKLYFSTVTNISVINRLTPDASAPYRPESSASQYDPTEPIMNITGLTDRDLDPEEGKLLVFNEMEDQDDQSSVITESDRGHCNNNQPVYIKHFEFGPEVLIVFDYQGKEVDMEQGILLGCASRASVSESVIVLKRLRKSGLNGFQKLLEFVANEWHKDLVAKQLPQIVAGFGLLRCINEIAHGVFNLIWLPVEQYKKDGRIFRGVQRGANSLFTSTLIATLELFNRVFITVQALAEMVTDLTVPGPSMRAGNKLRRYKRVKQPTDAREGVGNAFQVLSEGMVGTLNAFVDAAQSEHDYKGMVGTIGSVVRQTPRVFTEPLQDFCAASSQVLHGVRNQLNPDKKREDQLKWKDDIDG